MKAVAIRTPIIERGEDLIEFLKANLPKDQVSEGSILVITSKILSYAQDRFIKIGKFDKNDKQARAAETEKKRELVRQEADLYLDPTSSKYGIMLTIKDTLLAVNAGIDESNSDGYYILWPENLQVETNKIWQAMRQHFGLKKLGVVITDSRSMPLRWGVMGAAMSYCGFEPLINKIGTKDIFGKELEMTQMSVLESVAVAAVFEMGEGNEQRPVAVVSDFQQPVKFMDRKPSEEELAALTIDPNDDVYAPVLKSVPWKKGGGGSDLKKNLKEDEGTMSNGKK